MGVHPGLLFEKQSTLQSVSQMVQGYPTSHCPGTCRRTTSGTRTGKGSFSFRPIHWGRLVIPCGEIHDRYPYDRWNAHTATELKLRGIEDPGREVRGTMLNITGMNRFYYLRNFYDMRCKYDRVLSVIYRQLNREPEVFIVNLKRYWLRPNN